MEQWKCINGFKNTYEISSFGRVRRGNKYLKGGKNNSGYISYTLCNNGIAKTLLAHRLVANAFLKKETNKNQVNHKNGIKTDNTVKNLEWVSASENIKHSIRILGNKVRGSQRGKFGDKHNNSKQFWLDYGDGNLIYYGSGLELVRKEKFDHSSISYARKHFNSPYVFKRGKMKGVTLHFEL